ncbi:hypothetical protein [Bacillus cereus]
MTKQQSEKKSPLKTFIDGVSTVTSAAKGAISGASQEIANRNKSKESIAYEEKMKQAELQGQQFDAEVRKFKYEIRIASCANLAVFLPSVDDKDLALGFYEIKRYMKDFTFYATFESLKATLDIEEHDGTILGLMFQMPPEPGDEPDDVRLVDAQFFDEPRSVLKIYAQDRRDIPNDQKIMDGDSFLLASGTKKLHINSLLRSYLEGKGHGNFGKELIQMFKDSMADLKKEVAEAGFKSSEELQQIEQERIRKEEDARNRRLQSEESAAAVIQHLTNLAGGDLNKLTVLLNKNIDPQQTGQNMQPVYEQQIVQGQQTGQNMQPVYEQQIVQGQQTGQNMQQQIIQGQQTGQNMQPVPTQQFVQGQQTGQNMQPVYEQQIVQGTQPVYNQGHQIVQGTQPVYNQGHQIVQGTQPVYNQGHQIVQGTQPVYNQGHQPTQEQQPVYNQGHQIVQGTQPVYNQGHQPTQEQQPVQGIPETMLSHPMSPPNYGAAEIAQ